MSTTKYAVPSASAFIALDANGKRAARRDAEATMKAVIADTTLDPADAVRIHRELAAIVATWAPDTTPKPVDYTALRAVRGASLIVAGMAILAGTVRPDGVPADIPLDRIEWDDADALNAWADPATATRLATDAVRRGTRRDLDGEDGPTEAVAASAPSGTLWTYTELAHAVERATGRSRVSSGAIRNAVVDGRVPSLVHVPRHGKVPAKARRR